MDKISVKVKIRGIVQGVGFRYFTVLEARKTGVCGYVKNEPDGSVFSYAEGNEEDINSFVEFLKIGPASSTVENVDVVYGEWTGRYIDFKIEI